LTLHHPVEESILGGLLVAIPPDGSAKLALTHVIRNYIHFFCGQAISLFILSYSALISITQGKGKWPNLSL
jgi:hypothetical protein